MRNRFLEHEDMPEWFRLSINSQTGFPCLNIRTYALAQLASHLPDQATIERIRKNLRLPTSALPFDATFGNRFGFGDSLRRIPSRKNYITYECQLPVVLDEQSKLNSMDMWLLSMNIQILMIALAVYEPKHSLRPTTSRQLLTLNMGSKQGLHGCELCGVYSPHFVNFLKQHDVGHYFMPAENAMIRAYQHMLRSRELGENRMIGIRVRHYEHPGNLHMSLPGMNATSIGTHRGPRHIQSGRGVGWNSHNVDSPVQQLTILTGLAAMCDIVG